MNTKITAAQTTAEQCRAMGLKVGDTIQGRETYGDIWNDARLTLLFIGEQEAVFRAKSRSSLEPDWQDDGESADWTLDCREWVKVAVVSAVDTATSTEGEFDVHAPLKSAGTTAQYGFVRLVTHESLFAARDAEIARLTAERDEARRDNSALRDRLQNQALSIGQLQGALKQVDEHLGIGKSQGLWASATIDAAAAMRATHDALTAERDTLRKDAERLDLLIEKEFVVFEGPRKTFQIRDAREDRAIGGIFDDARAAIDALIKAEKA
jgi:hypothetical protein